MTLATELLMPVYETNHKEAEQRRRKKTQISETAAQKSRRAALIKHLQNDFENQCNHHRG
jgi:hypothetical protein